MIKREKKKKKKRKKREKREKGRGREEILYMIPYGGIFIFI